jgi:hypothetical protein
MSNLVFLRLKEKKKQEKFLSNRKKKNKKKSPAAANGKAENEIWHKVIGLNA